MSWSGIWAGPPGPADQRIQAYVGGDPIQPRLQRGATLERVQPTPGLHQRLLAGVLGVLQARPASGSSAPQLTAVPRNDLLDGRVVAGIAGAVGGDRHGGGPYANIVSFAGLVPVMGLAESADLCGLVAEKVRLPSSIGSNPAGKVSTIVAGMVAGADCIDDLDVVRHGGMSTLFSGVYAPSTVGSFLREFTHGHVVQLLAAISPAAGIAVRYRNEGGNPSPCPMRVGDLVQRHDRVYSRRKRPAVADHGETCSCTAAVIKAPS